MNHDQFVGQVQAAAHFGSRGDAERIIRATLKTLAERLDGDMADNLAAQLPSEIAHHLRTDTAFERLSLDEFVRRVQMREMEGGHRVDLAAATYHARVVMEVLQQALTPGAVEKLRTQLPADFEPLLSGPTGSPARRAASDRQATEPQTSNPELGRS